MSLAADQQQSLLAQFFERTEVFMQYFSSLQASLPSVKSSPELHDEVSRVLADGEKLRSRIDAIKQGIDSAVDFAQTSWGNITDWAKSVIGLNGMGALPFIIPAATLAGVSTAIYLLNQWIERAHQAQIKINQYNELVKQGHSPLEAATITNRILQQRAKAGILEKLMWGGLIIGGGYLLWKNKGLLGS